MATSTNTTKNFKNMSFNPFESNQALLNKLAKHKHIFIIP